MLINLNCQNHICFFTDIKELLFCLLWHTYVYLQYQYNPACKCHCSLLHSFTSGHFKNKPVCTYLHLFDTYLAESGHQDILHVKHTRKNGITGKKCKCQKNSVTSQKAQKASHIIMIC